MKQKTIFLFVSFAVFLLTAFSLIKQTPSPQTKPFVINNNFEIPVTQTIISPAGLLTSTLSATLNESALSLLKRSQDVETKLYSYGELVEGISGIKNGTNNSYWLYFINGQEAKVGADQYLLQPNDQITWEFKSL